MDNSKRRCLDSKSQTKIPEPARPTTINLNNLGSQQASFPDLWSECLTPHIIYLQRDITLQNPQALPFERTNRNFRGDHSFELGRLWNSRRIAPQATSATEEKRPSPTVPLRMSYLLPETYYRGLNNYQYYSGGSLQYL